MALIPQDVANKAADIQGRLNSTTSAVRSNGDLTPDARLRQLAQAYYGAEDQMGALRHAWMSDTETATTTTTADVFGAVSTSGADAISVRDAADRAEQLTTPQQALVLLQQAENTGDQVLARAVAQKALDTYIGEPFGDDWACVVDAYTLSRPQVGEKIMELIDQRRTSALQVTENMFIFAVPKPAELDGVLGTVARAMAAQAGPQ